MGELADIHFSSVRFPHPGFNVDLTVVQKWMIWSLVEPTIIMFMRARVSDGQTLSEGEVSYSRRSIEHAKAKALAASR